MHTMTKKQGKSGTIDIKAVLAEDEEFLRALVRMALQEVLEAEMTEALGAEKGERTSGRQGVRLIGKAAAAGQQPGILAPPNRLADPLRRDLQSQNDIDPRSPSLCGLSRPELEVRIQFPPVNRRPTGTPPPISDKTLIL
jgi:hypothetical protein